MNNVMWDPVSGQPGSPGVSDPAKKGAVLRAMTTPTTPQRILVAMSGGVDSSVAAGLLVEQGFDVVGAFMRNGVKANPARSHRQGCCGLDDASDARRVADRLGIPFYALNFEDAFEELIGDFVHAYAEGRTPNPCIECNRKFKMGALLHLARRLDASAVATGHYARIERRADRWCVAQGADVDKDQSYVLFGLDQDVLEHTRLPLGHLTKREVRRHARRLELPVAEKPESMEICFVPTGDYRDVLRERAGDVLRPGPIVDQSGVVIGRHDGTASFTIGQRRGLPGGQRDPIYVTALDPETATVTVGDKGDLLRTRFVVRDVVWSGEAPPPRGTVLRGRMQIRAHHEPVPAAVTAVGDDTLDVVLDAPVEAVTPGQAAVLYGEDRVLVGGWITREEVAV